MNKVLWFSRHEMTEEQLAALGNVSQLVQVNKTINSAYELAEEIAAADIVAIVAPINLQKQFLELAGDKPVLIAQSKRVLVPNADGGEDKANFVFDGWKQLKKIEVVTEDWQPSE